MQRRFIALRIISVIYKVMALLAFIGMVVVIGLNVSAAASDLSLGNPAVANIVVALGVGLGSMIMLFALGQLFDLLIALEENTRATTIMLQRMGKLMQERL